MSLKWIKDQVSLLKVFALVTSAITMASTWLLCHGSSHYLTCWSYMK